MPVTFEGRECLDPESLLRDAQRLGLDCSWAGSANRYRCNDGVEPGEGAVLLSYKDLKAIDPLSTPRFSKAGGYTCVWKSDTQVRGGLPSLPDLTLRQLTVTSLECVVESARDQDENAYLVRFADKRYLASLVPVSAGYNAKQPAFPNLDIPGTLKDNADGTLGDWGWGSILTDLWRRVGTDKLGAVPTFPSSSTPLGGLEFWNTYGLKAIGEILDRLGWALCYNPATDTMKVVVLGAADSQFDAGFTAWDTWRVADRYPKRPVKATVPEKVRVLFRKFSHQLGDPGGEEIAFIVPSSAANANHAAYASFIEAGTVATLHDDLPAQIDPLTGSLTNASTLQSKAEARAAEYYRMQEAVAGPMEVTYPLLLTDSRLMPGSQVREVVWSESGGRLPGDTGMTTRVVRRGGVPRPMPPSRSVTPDREVALQLVGKSYSGDCPTYDGYEVDLGDNCAVTAGQPTRLPVYHLRGVDLPYYQAPSPQTARPAAAASLNTAGDVDWRDAHHAMKAWNPSGYSADSNPEEYASCQLAQSQSTRYLKLWKFPFRIPTGATVTKYKPFIRARADGGSVTDTEVKLLIAGAVSGNNKAASAALGTSDATVTYDYSPSGWGVAATPATANNVDFGFVARFANGAAATRNVYVSYAGMTIEFDMGGVGYAQSVLYRAWRRPDGGAYVVDTNGRWEPVEVAGDDIDDIVLDGVTYRPGWLLRYNGSGGTTRGEEILVWVWRQ